MKKVIIIGAGPAGITAGYELLKNRDGGPQRYEVTILEETDAIGGISRTVVHNGNRMDIGGHRFFSRDDSVTAWWDEIMPRQGAPAFDDRLLGRQPPVTPGGPDPEVSDRVMLTRSRVSRIYYKKKFFDYPVKMNWNTVKNMGFVTTLAAGLSYLVSVAHKLPEDSLENFYINRFGRKLYSMFFEGYTQKLWGRHPSAISADWGAQRVKGLSIPAIIRDILLRALPGRGGAAVETSLIQEFRYPKFGPGQLWETAAQEFETMGGVIRQKCKVLGLRTEGAAVTQVLYEEGGVQKTISGDYVLSSMPLKDLIEGMNDVPEEARRIAAGLPYRDFVTVGLCVKRMDLKNETRLKTLQNIVPDCWIYVQDTGVKLGRIQIFNNWSPYMVARPEETVWIGLEYFCAEGDEYWRMSEKEWVSFAVGELVEMGIISGEEDVLDCHRERVKKAYPAYFDTYYEIGKLTAWLDGFENLFCIGRNGQHRYNNMDHSMATAFEAVKNIKSGVTAKDNIWSVNTEETYHEEK